MTRLISTTRLISMACRGIRRYEAMRYHDKQDMRYHDKQDMRYHDKQDMRYHDKQDYVSYDTPHIWRVVVYVDMRRVMVS